METKEKKELSNTAKIAVGVGMIMLVIGAYYLGRITGYNKGFDKGTGWQ